MSHTTVWVAPGDRPRVSRFCTDGPVSVYVNDDDWYGDSLRFDSRDDARRWFAAALAQFDTGEVVHPPRNERPTPEVPAVAPVVQRYCPVHGYTTHTVTSTGLRDQWACAECGHVANDPQRVEAVPA